MTNPVDPELREQIVQARYSKYETYEKLDPTEQEIIDGICMVVAKTITEARIDEVQRFAQNTIKFPNGYYGVTSVELAHRLAELQPPTAESEVVG